MAEWSQANIDSWEGGLNLTDAPHLAKLLRAEDAIYEGRGSIRMRGGYSDREPETVFGKNGTLGNDEKVFGTTRYTLTQGLQGIIFVTQDYVDKVTRVYFARDNEDPVMVFRHADHTSTGAHRKWRQYQATDGWSPKKSETGNARNNVLMMTCKAFTIALRLRPDEAYDAGSNQFVGQFNDGNETIYFEATVLLNATGTFQRPGGADISVTAKAQGRATSVGTAGGYTFLGGLSGSLNQYIAYSKIEDSDSFSREGSDPAPFADIFQVPDDEGSEVTALRGRGNILLIFKQETIYRLNLDARVGSWKLNDPLGEIGCRHAESIKSWNEFEIFADRWGVYMTDGFSVTDISSEAIGPLYRAYYQGTPFYDETWQLQAAVVGDHYILSVTDSDGEYVVTWVCHLPSKTWTTFTGFHMTASCLTEAGFGVYATMKQGTKYRVVNIERCFRSASRTDPYDRGYEAPDAGSPNTPHFLIEVGRLALENTMQEMWVRQFSLRYECSGDSAGDTLTVRPVLGLDPDAIPGDVLHTFPRNYNMERAWADECGFETNAIGWVIEAAGSPKRVVINALTISYKPMRESRSNSTRNNA